MNSLKGSQDCLVRLLVSLEEIILFNTVPIRISYLVFLLPLIYCQLQHQRNSLGKLWTIALDVCLFLACSFAVEH